jgi:hypothetical protein
VDGVDMPLSGSTIVDPPNVGLMAAYKAPLPSPARTVRPRAYCSPPVTSH